MRLLPLAAWCAWAPRGVGALGAAGAAQRRQSLREALLRVTAEAADGRRGQEKEVDASRFWFQAEQEQAEQDVSSHVIMDDDGDAPAPPPADVPAPARREEARKVHENIVKLREENARLRAEAAKLGFGQAALALISEAGPAMAGDDAHGPDGQDLRRQVAIENPPDDEDAMSSGQVAAGERPAEATAGGAAAPTAVAAPLAASAAEPQPPPAQDILDLVRGAEKALAERAPERATSLTHAMPGPEDEVQEVPVMLDPVVSPAMPSDDCALSMWTDWSDCQQLHDGYKVWFAVRTRVVIAGERDKDGVPCPVSQPGGLLQQRACVRVSSRWQMPAGDLA